MNGFELGKLVTYITVGDNRQVDELTLEFWADMVGHLEYADCKEAVIRHRKSSTDYLQAAHVIAGVAAIEKERRSARLHAQQQMTAIESGPAVFQRTDDQQEHVSNRAAWLRAELERLSKAKSVPAEPTATVKDPV